MSQLVSEEIDRIDARNPVRAAGQALARNFWVRVVGEGNERLTEEQGHDRQVVPEQTPGGESEYEPDERGCHDDDGNRCLGLPVDPVVVGREQRVGVGPESVEGDIAQIEQARETDDDVEPEREDGVEQGVEPVREQVALVQP